MGNFKACLLKTAGITQSDRKRLAARAKEANTGDAQQDYVMAVTDTLAELHNLRAAVEKAMQDAQPTTKTMFSLNESEPALVERKVEATTKAEKTESDKAEAKRLAEEAEAKAEANDRKSWRREIDKAASFMERAKVNNLEQRRQYVKHLTWLMSMLYEKTEGAKRIKEVLDSLFFNGKVDAMFREALEETARAYGVLDMEFSAKDGTVNPLFEYINRAHMFHALKELAQYKNLPPTHAQPSIMPTPAEKARQAETLAKLPKRKPRMVRAKFALTAEEAADEDAATDTTDTGPAAADLAAIEATTAPPAIAAFPQALALSNAIMDINGSASQVKQAAFKSKVKNLARLYAAVVAEGTHSFVTPEGQPLSAYFVDGEPRVTHADKQMKVQTEDTARVRTAEVSAEALSVAERKAAAEREKAEEGYTPTSNFDDWSTGRWFRDNGEPLVAPVAPGRVRMMVREFVSKLKLKPLVHVYASQADFAQQNPEAYARAKAAYPHQDFDSVSAVGYSFGHEIAIFTDRVATSRQLKFVLAHETLGHFGFRALMPENELTAILHAIYGQSPHIKAVADIAMAARGLTKAEAVEEYLADFAGTLENNVLARVWNRVKDFLKVFGLNFEDDMARYLLSQSRAYVRNGTTHGSFVNFRNIAQRWLDIETLQDPIGVGRFAVSAAQYGQANRMAVEAARTPTALDNMEAFNQRLKDKGIDLQNAYREWSSSLTTMNYAARNNFGFRRMYEILRDTVHESSKLRSKYNAMMATVLQPAIELGGHQFTKGSTQAQIAQVGKMLKTTSLVRSQLLTNNKLRRMGGLFNYVDGEAKRNPEVINELKAQGRVPIEEFRKGFTYTTFHAEPMTAAHQADINQQRAKALEGKTDAKEIKDINEEYDDLAGADTFMAPVETTFPPMKDLTEDSLEWKMYLQVRDTVDEAALDLLNANFTAVKGERENVLRIVRRFLGRPLEDPDRKFIEKIETKYLTMRRVDSVITGDGMISYKKTSIDKANNFMAKFNEMVLANETDKYPALKEFLDDKEYDDVVSGLTMLKKGAHIAKSEDKKFTMQQAIQNLAMFEMGRDDAHLFAKRTIAGGYVPFGREGAWQVRVNAVDPDTKRVYKVHDLYRQNLVYMQMDQKSEALHSAKAVNRVFEEGNAGKSFKLKVLDTDNQWRVKTVLLEAKAETARETAPANKETNLNEIISTLSQFSIDLHPEERERLITGLTEQNHRARTRLYRAASPGEDTNVIKYVSQHLEATASTVARKTNRHHLDRLFDDKDGNSERLWNGDPEQYARLKKAWEDAEKNPALNEHQKTHAKREFDDYHYTYITKEAPVHANKYKDDAAKLLAFLDAQRDVEFTDFGSSEAVSKARLWMTFAMMGASPATAFLNFISLGTNVVPALAGYNEKNGFGGGFGLARSSTEMSRALGLVKSDKLSDVAYWDNLLERVSEDGPLKDPNRLRDAGFTEVEAQFMKNQVGSGAMQAALTNAMLGSARGKLTSGLAQQAAKKWMFLFNYSEQVARRSTGLAAFRMAYERELGARVEMAKESPLEAQAQAFAAAEKFAVEMIDNTLGQYAMFNRPAWFRGGFGQFVFMYKMFPVNAWQMLKSLGRNEKLLALGLLMLFSGLKGLPFAEDLMDVLDTLAQMLGLGPNKVWKGSAEKTVAEFLNWVSPGMTPVLMRGALNHIMPANISDRTSLGNIVPGSGILLAGSEVGRELVEIGGPFASFVQGSIATAGRTTKLMLDPSEASLITTLRGSPITMMRAVGDTWAYTNSGAIVNQRGYVVSRDLHIGVKAMRMLGFYPSSAVTENDVVKIGTRLSDYRKDIAAHFYSRYIMASMSHDRDEVNEVLDDVADWNDGAKGTELELTNFRSAARRALREAKRSASERYLRTIPRNTRKEVQHIKDMLMTDSEEEAAAAGAGG